MNVQIDMVVVSEKEGSVFANSQRGIWRSHWSSGRGSVLFVQSAADHCCDVTKYARRARGEWAAGIGE